MNHFWSIRHKRKSAGWQGVGRRRLLEMLLACKRETLREMVVFVSRYCCAWKGCLELPQPSCNYERSQSEDK